MVSEFTLQRLLRQLDHLIGVVEQASQFRCWKRVGSLSFLRFHRGQRLFGADPPTLGLDCYLQLAGTCLIRLTLTPLAGPRNARRRHRVSQYSTCFLHPIGLLLSGC